MRLMKRLYVLPFVLLVALSSLWMGATLIAAQDAMTETNEQSLTSLAILENLPSAEPDLSTYPVTVENCGRELSFDAPPERVISLWQPPTEILLALGLENRIIALAGSYAPYPDEFAPIVEGIPAIGTAMAWPAREVLLAEQPDFVISEGLDSFGYDASLGYATVEEIEASGATVYASAACSYANPESTPRNIDRVLNDIRTLGTIFGVSERAEELIARMEAQRQTVKDAVRGRDPVRVAFYNGGQGPLFVLNSSMWADLLVTAGGESVFDPTAFQVSVEEFAAADPEVILMGTYPGQSAEDLSTFLQTTFPTVSAVQNGRLYPVETINVENSIRIMYGLETIAKALHPDAFAEASAAPAAATEQTQYPVTIENCGRTLTFDAPPQRVLATWQNTGEIMLALGLEDKLVGVYFGQPYAALPEYEGRYDSFNIFPQRQLPSRELIVSAEADFVFAAYPTFDFSAENGLVTAEEFLEAGANVYGLTDQCIDNPQTFSLDNLYQDILNIGIIFDVQAEAQALVADMQGRIAAVQERVSGREPVDVIMVDRGNGPIGVWGRGYESVLIELAGGRNLYGDADGSYIEVGIEAFATQDPDLLIVYDYEDAEGVPDEAEYAAFLFETFPNMRPSQEQRYATIGAETNTGIRAPLAVERLARQFHPEAFTDTTSAPVTPSQTQYPVTIETCGRTITVNAPPQRVYTTYWNGFDLLARLGLVDRVVGNAYQGDYDGGEFAEQYAQIPNQYERYPAAEEALALQADLVIASYDTFDFPPETLSIEDWSASGTPVYSMSTECGGGDATQARFEMFFDDVRNIGIIFDVQTEAEALIAEMQGRLDAVQSALGDTQPVTAMIYYGGEGPLNVFTNGVYGSIIELAGGQTIFPDAERTVEEASPEVIAALAPQAYLIIPWTDTFDNLRTFLYTTFPDAPATLNDQALLMPDGTTPAGYRTVEAIEQLAQMLHPEAFE